MKPEKVLIITYYWPPSGGSGVQRWLKFVKYLPEFGVTPFVFTPENPSFDVRDESLLRDVPGEAEVIRFPIWEPYDAFSRVSGVLGGKKKGDPRLVSGKTGKETLFQKVSTWLRGNVMVPDPRVFWVRSSVRFLSDFLRDHDISVIITTGPPHSVHLIGYYLKKKLPSIRWMADFRDPWSEWGLLDSLHAGTVARKIHRSLEKKVLTTADIVTTITPFYVRSFEKLSGRSVRLLTNGYDESDFVNLAPVKTERFVIRHVGIVNEKCNPRPFMQALKNAVAVNPELAKALHLDFVGQVHPAFRDFVLEDPVMNSFTTFTPPVPHKDLIELYNRSSVLLLVLEGYKDAEGYMPGKLFEYIATGLPVLGVGPENGDAAQLMLEAGVGSMVSASDADGMKTALFTYFAHWQQTGQKSGDRMITKNYSRRSLTGKLVDEILSDKW